MNEEFGFTNMYIVHLCTIRNVSNYSFMSSAHFLGSNGVGFLRNLMMGSL